jgi:signal peptidase II
VHVPARRLLFAVVVAVVAIDQVSKALAVHLLAGRGVVSILGGALHVQLYRNFAGSANRLTGHPVLVSLLALLAVAVIAAVAMRARSRVAAVAGGLMLGGGISNLLDRLLRAPGPLRGGVVDWLKPTASGGSMNLADLAITAGVAVLAVGMLVAAWRSRAGRPLPGQA